MCAFCKRGESESCLADSPIPSFGLYANSNLSKWLPNVTRQNKPLPRISRSPGTDPPGAASREFLKRFAILRAREKDFAYTSLEVYETIFSSSGSYSLITARQIAGAISVRSFMPCVNSSRADLLPITSAGTSASVCLRVDRSSMFP